MSGIPDSCVDPLVDNLLSRKEKVMVKSVQSRQENIEPELPVVSDEQHFRASWIPQTSMRIKVLSLHRVGYHPELSSYRQGLWAILPMSNECFL
ncbi:hypothetical protein DRO66_09905 [Candidatus Bathyarchaeota archaeon]|nr:MAG: hypothetical protein DRO66_09905 [Candidatus Bathyarchaeota archaeon]